MDLPAILAIIGGIALFVGILGGGIEVKEIKIPSISRQARNLSTFSGIILIGISIYTYSISQPLTQEITPTNPTAISTTNNITQVPTSNPIFSTNIVPLPTNTLISTFTCPELNLSQVKRHSKPTILFDEAHGNDLSLSEERAHQIDPHPQMFPYAGDLADFIGQQGYQFEVFETGEFSLNNVLTYDLLIVSVGKSSINFSACEIETITAFVEKGGGLLIFGNGDHNNQINTILEPFGVRMGVSPVMDIDVSVMPENFWITNFSGHPAVNNTTYAWFNWGTNIEILDEAWSILMNSPENTWLDGNNDRIIGDVEPRGPFILGAAREYGNGRIIVYGDNNVWDFYRDPNYPMYLSIIQWVIGDPARPLP